MCFSPQRRAMLRHQNFKKFSEDYSFSTFSLPNVLFATAACNFSTSELQKVLRHRQFLTFSLPNVLFATAACNFSTKNFKKCSEDYSFSTFSHPNVLFATAAFNFSTSELQKVLRHRQFCQHFHIQMCFSPQRRAIFRHQNFKKCSDTVSFLAFSLQNVLFATAACNFWFLLWAPTSAPDALTGLLFDWPDTRIIEKTQHFATSLTFGADVSSFFWLSRYCIFFLLTWLLYFAFQLSILSEVFI